MNKPVTVSDFNTLVADFRRDKRLRKKIKGQKRSPQKSEALARRPDAVVMILFKAKCTRCSTIKEYPNKRLLFRFDNNLSRPKEIPEGYSDMPREVLFRNEVVEACENCFGQGALSLHLQSEDKQ